MFKWISKSWSKSSSLNMNAFTKTHFKGLNALSHTSFHSYHKDFFTRVARGVNSLLKFFLWTCDITKLTPRISKANTNLGGSQSKISLILWSSICNPSLVILCLRNFTSFTPNSYSLNLAYNLCSFSFWNILKKCSTCSSIVML